MLVVDQPDEVRRQAVPLGTGAKRSLVVLAGMVVLLASGLTPPAFAGLLAACAIVVAGVLTIEQAYRGIQWTTVILVAGMIPLATAMTETGAAKRLADGLVDVVGDAGPRALLVGLVLLVFVLGTETAGSRLTLRIGPFSGQPSELLKVILVVFLAGYLSENRPLLIEQDTRLGPLRLPPLPYLAPMVAKLGIERPAQRELAR